MYSHLSNVKFKDHLISLDATFKMRGPLMQTLIPEMRLFKPLTLLGLVT